MLWLLASPIILIVLLNVGVNLLLTNAANDGALAGNARVYAAEDDSSLAVLTQALGQGDYLTPRDFDFAVSRSRGHIVKLDASTPVHRLGDHFFANQQFLRIRVKEGPSAGLTVLVPARFRNQIHFYDRNASL